MRTLLILLILPLSHNIYNRKIPLNIEIDNLRNSEGSVIITVFKDQKGFDDDIPVMRKAIPKKGNMKNGIFKTKISLPQGIYGLALFDDENDDGEMNYNLVGMPKEGYGFSNFYHTGLKKPKFSDFSFKLSANTGIMKIRLRYM